MYVLRESSPPSTTPISHGDPGVISGGGGGNAMAVVALAWTRTADGSFEGSDAAVGVADVSAVNVFVLFGRVAVYCGSTVVVSRGSIVAMFADAPVEIPVSETVMDDADGGRSGCSDPVGLFSLSASGSMITGEDVPAIGSVIGSASVVVVANAASKAALLSAEALEGS